MAANTTIVARDIHDFKVAGVLSDCNDATAGNVYTNGPQFDLPGVTEFSVSFESDTDELRGDGGIKDIFSRLEKATGSFGGCIDLNVLQALLGGCVYAPQAGTNRLRFGPEATPYIQVESQTTFHTGVGDLHVRLWKARVTNVSWEQSAQNYVTFSADYEAIPTLFEWTDPAEATKVSRLFVDIDINDAETAITAPATP